MEKDKNNQGWVKIWRQLADTDLWLDEPFTKGQAWVDLIMGANHTDKEINIRGNKIKIKRGQLGWSEVTLTKRWKWSRNKVRNFKMSLNRYKMIEQQKYKYITTITTILNYDKFQTIQQKKQATEQQTEQQKKHNQEELKNLKNNSLGGENAATTEPFNQGEWVRGLREGTRKDLKIIGAYILEKDLKFENKAQAEQELRRNLRPARDLAAWKGEQIRATINWLDDNELTWTLETIAKHIAEYGDYKRRGEDSQWPEIPSL